MECVIKDMKVLRWEATVERIEVDAVEAMEQVVKTSGLLGSE
jgi:hypothetical protein